MLAFFSSNIYLKNDRLLIGDLGISVKANANSIIGGTPCYMAPEIAEAFVKKKDLDVASFSSDMWALGCVVYELATLKKAFHARSKEIVFKSIREEAPPEVESSYFINSILIR